jgi:hypothetical protein
MRDGAKVGADKNTIVFAAGDTSLSGYGGGTHASRPYTVIEGKEASALCPGTVLAKFDDAFAVDQLNTELGEVAAENALNPATLKIPRSRCAHQRDVVGWPGRFDLCCGLDGKRTAPYSQNPQPVSTASAELLP